MTVQWMQAKFPGVRFYEHLDRKHGIRPDKNFYLRYRYQGKRYEEHVGWASQGWSAEKASIELSKLKEAHTTGNGPVSLAEKRELERLRREKVKAEEARLEKENISFGQYFQETYLPPEEGGDKKKKHKNKELRRFTEEQRKFITEEQLFRLWLAPHIGSIPFKDISEFHMRKIKKAMLDAKKSARTIQYAFAVVRQVWNMARRDKTAAGDCPTIHTKAPKFDNKRLRFLSFTEAETLLTALKDRSEQLHNIALMSLRTGMRAGEIFKLQWGYIDFARGLLNIVNTKTKRNRVAFMTDDVKTMLQNVHGHGKDKNAFVFYNSKGEPIKEISSSFDRTVKQIGFNDGVVDRPQKVVFHTLRHTFASWHIESGTTLYTLKELMGHSTLAMTERYSHLGQNKQQDAVKDLEASMEQKRIELEEKRKEEQKRLELENKEKGKTKQPKFIIRRGK